MAEQNADDVVAIYRAGSVAADVLEDRLPSAWARAVSDESTRLALAGLFGVGPESLDRNAVPPFRLKPDRAGMDISSVAITVLVWAGSDVFLGALTGIARDEVKRRLIQAWALLEPKLRDEFDARDALGPTRPLEGTPSSSDDG